MSDEYTDQQTHFDPAIKRLLDDAGIEGGGNPLTGVLGVFGYDNMDSRGLIETVSEEEAYKLTGSYVPENVIGTVLGRLQAEYDRDPNSEGGRQYQELVTYVQENKPSTTGAVWDHLTGNDANGATAGIMAKIASNANGAEQAVLAFGMAGVDAEKVNQIQLELMEHPEAMDAIEAAVTGMGGGDGGNLDFGALQENLANNKELLQTLGNRPQEFVRLVEELGPEGTTALLNTAGNEGPGMDPEQMQQIVNSALDHPETVGAVLNSDVFEGMSQKGLSLNPEELTQNLEDAPLEQKIDLLYDVAVAQNPSLGAGREEFQEKLQNAIEQNPDIENDINEMVSGMSNGMAGGDLGQTLETLEQIAPQFASFASSDMADNLLSKPDLLHNALNFGELNFDQKLETAFAIAAPEADTSALNSMLENNPEVKGKLETVMNSLMGGEEGGTPDLQNLAGTLNAAEPILTVAAQNPEKIEALLNNVETEDLTVLMNSVGGIDGSGDPSMAGDFFQMALDNPEIVGSLLSSEAFDKMAEDGNIDFNNLAGELEDVPLDSKVDLLFDLAASAIIGDSPEEEAQRAQLLEDKERLGEQLNTAIEKNPELEGLINTELAGQINSAMTGGSEGGSGDMLADLGANAQTFASILASKPFETMLSKDHLTKAAIARAQELDENGEPVGLMKSGADVFITDTIGYVFGNNPDRLNTVGMLQMFGGTQGLAGMITGAFGQGNNTDGNMLMGLFSSFLDSSGDGENIMGVGDPGLAETGMSKLQELGLIKDFEISRLRNATGMELTTTDELYLAVDAAYGDVYENRNADDFARSVTFVNGYNPDGTPKTEMADPDGPEGPQEPVEQPYQLPEWADQTVQPAAPVG